jgi:hypothetical protein
MVRRRFAVTAAAVLLLVSAAATSIARADDNPWPWPTVCTEAALTDYHLAVGANEITLSVSGWIQPCNGMADPGAWRSFAVYRNNDAQLSGHVYPIFDPETKSYAFSVSGSMGSTGHEPTYTAACLVDGVTLTGDKHRVPSRKACVALNLTGMHLAITQVPTTDPRVAANLGQPWFYPEDPHCGTCL